MQTLREIKGLLAARGLRPKHRLGQNFLHDKNQLTKLIDAADVQPGDLVLEVGPGTGTLTAALLERGTDLIACELDPDMAAILREVFARSLAEKTLTILEGDCLDRGRTLNPAVVAAIGSRPFKLVANLPYQAASPLMSVLLIDHDNCLGQFVTIQREVAERLRAAPSTKEYGPLSIIIQSMATVRVIGTLSPACFWPQPAVNSAMVAIMPSPRAGLLATAAMRRDFARFMTELFSSRRKQLGTSLRGVVFDWPQGVEPSMRIESLDASQAQALWRAARRGAA